MPIDLPQPQFGIIQQLDPHFSTFQYQDGSGMAQVWSYGGITAFVPPARVGLPEPPGYSRQLPGQTRPRGYNEAVQKCTECDVVDNDADSEDD